MERSAFHESGHIVMAYFGGYSCPNVLLDGQGDGFIGVDYGADLLSVTGIINARREPQFFEALTTEQQNRGIEIADIITQILFGGPTAEALSQVGIEFAGTLPIEAGGPDLERIENIETLLSINIEDFNFNSFEQRNLRTVLTLMRLPEVWMAITQLAQELLASPTLSLNQNAIETSLNRSGFIEFLASLQEPN